jgi:hypothetical protein
MSLLLGDSSGWCDTRPPCCIWVPRAGALTARPCLRLLGCWCVTANPDTGLQKRFYSRRRFHHLCRFILRK